MPEFVRRSREALGMASDRVNEKYGFSCSRAAASVERDGDVEVEALRR
ncbi:hypothetical protein GCM10009609_26530 [Pseudonocardia aurantiaca]|uniref:Uncharacterized protein n=1 Tax=Pseudonocardia aurantiaca TaxID=75290 RepID=A0ABW4FIG4_9PSEU